MAIVREVPYFTYTLTIKEKNRRLRNSVESDNKKKGQTVSLK